MKRPLNPTSRRKRPCRMPRIAAAILLTALTAIAAPKARADEGMWLPSLIGERIDDMRAKGFRLTAEDIYSVNEASMKDAVVLFNGGCTGELISPEGLLVTNHHCGYGAIQGHSTVEHDYLTHGFWARDRSEELPNEGLWVRRLVRMEEVTDRLAAGETAEKICEEAAEKGRYRTAIEQMYYGNQQFLFVYEQFDDVRLVGAPPSSIGKFGGDTDNWMWPRHTGDFSMFRIYADKNGEPAEYSQDNVPLQTPKYLSISIKGLQENDYAMIMGFPGRTSRYLTRSEVKERMEADNQAMIDMRGVRLDVLRTYMNASNKTRIQYASKFARSSNYWKNSIGMNKAIIDNDVLGTKAEQEKKFAEFAKGKPEYEGVVDKIDGIIAKRKPVSRQLEYLYEALSGAIEFGSPYMVMDNIKTALEEKNDSLLTASKAQLEEVFNSIHNKDYDHEVDRAVAKAILPALAQKLKPEELPTFYLTIRDKYKGDYNVFVDDLYDNSILANRTNFDKFMKKPTVKAIEKDPATAYSRSKLEKLNAVIMENRALSNDLDLLHKAYIRGLGEMKLPVPSYPDANFTLRLTYGNVKSYDPRDAVHYNYYTTTDGILEKENPEDREFVVPAKLKELILNKDFGRYAMSDGTMPVCFLTTNDITGGNSGSPVINGEGQLIGCAFDGNWESLSGDINFNNNLQRCIALDIRYVLFILEKLGGCGHLIKEMNIIE